MAIVYQHRRLDTNEVFYIGIGETKKRSKVFHGRSIDWVKIAKESDISVEILFENITIEDAQKIEIDLIKKYGRQDLGLGPLVNLTDGGEFNMSNLGKISIHKDEKIKFISPKQWEDYSKAGWEKGRPQYVSEKIKSKWTKERKIKYRDEFSGSNAYWYGKTGEGTPMYGKKRLDIKGDKHWMKKEKYKKMISDRMSGENNPMYGKIYDAHPRAKKIDQFSLDGSYIRTWNCIIEAKKELNIFHIDKVCLGKRKSSGGYIWKYKN